MGGPRAGADTQSLATSTSSAGSAERSSLPGRRWLAVLAAYLLAGVALFTVYLRLSETYPLNSDSANILLMGWDLLHGHLLLHGWYMSDVSFYPTELPQYALLESFLGLHMQTAHVAAAMTYTLTFLLAVLLARSGSTGREAMIRTLIAAGIMLAPQFGLGVFALDLSVGHIGTSVPLLLIWLLLDRMPARWYVPVLTAVLLAWALVADPIVYVVGVGPLGAVAAARVIRGLVSDGGPWTDRIARQWYDLSLGAATVAATALAWVVNNLLSALGGYTVNRLPFYLVSWHNLHNNAPAAWKVLEIFGANYTGLSGVWLFLAFLHMASVLVVLWALVRVAWRFFSVSLVDQVLAVAIVLNVALFLLTNASDEAAHEVAIILPFGAVLAARVLTRRVPAVQGATANDGKEGPASSGLARRVRLAGLCRRDPGAGRLHRRARIRAHPADCPSGQHQPGVLAGGAPSQLRAQRLLDQQQRHGGQRRAGRDQGPDAVHDEAGPVDVQCVVVRPEVALRQLHRPGQSAGLHEPLGAASARPEVLRPPGPDLSHRPLHRPGLEQEPAQQHPAVMESVG